MLAALQFQYPLLWFAAIPAALAAVLSAWRHRRSGLPPSQAFTLAGLRGLALFVLVFLAARPVWIAKEPPASSAARSVVLLLDRSESMSLEEPDTSRYQRAVEFLRERLLPALHSANLPVQAMLFDKSAEVADGEKLTS